jgi:hypothetical protein
MKDNNWEEEFDVLFVDKTTSVDRIIYSANPVKNYVRKLLAAEREEACRAGEKAALTKLDEACKRENPSVAAIADYVKDELRRLSGA